MSCESDNEEDDNNDQREAPVYVEKTVETLSVTLVTTRLFVGEDFVSERR